MSAAIKIDKPIVDQRVSKSKPVAAAPAPAQETPTPAVQPVQMNERIERPEFLMGSTYKIKPATADHAMYITINDILLNEGTDHETRQPYEIFINSKSMDNFQWTIALTRVISAVFRKGGDISFLVEELLSVYDPNGGYFKKGGHYMPSVVAEIGTVIRRHLQAVGVIKVEELDEGQKKLIADKKAQLAAQEASASQGSDTGDYPANATLCQKCHTKAVVIMDGCGTCLSCGDSKCQ